MTLKNKNQVSVFKKYFPCREGVGVEIVLGIVKHNQRLQTHEKPEIEAILDVVNNVRRLKRPVSCVILYVWNKLDFLTSKHFCLNMCHTDVPTNWTGPTAQICGCGALGPTNIGARVHTHLISTLSQIYLITDPFLNDNLICPKLQWFLHF